MPLSLPGPLEAAIVDLDGTLVDTLGDFAAALNIMLDDLGLAPVATGVVAGFIGKGSEHLIRATLAHVGAPAELYPRAWESYQAAYRGLNGRFAQVYWAYADDTVEDKIAEIVCRRIRSMKAMVGDDIETMHEIERLLAGAA